MRLPTRLSIALQTICLLAGMHVLQAEERRPMVPEDYYRFQFPSSPRLSPDSSEVVFQVTTVAEDRRSRETGLWLVDTEDGEAWRLTGGDHDSHPRWSPDGAHIAFLRPAASSKDEDKEESQVFWLRRTGGEARQITSIEGGVSSFLFSPDGQQLLLTRRTEEPKIETAKGTGESDATEPTTPAEDSESEEPEPDVRVIRDALYKRNGSGYLNAKRSHFWLFDIASGELEQLTFGADWNDSNPAFSPDGKHLAFDSDRSGLEYDGGANDDLWILDLAIEGADEGRPSPRQLTQHPHRDSSPQWSPDGRRIAYLNTEDSYAQTEILLRDVDGGEPRTLTASFDRHPSNLRWTPDGKSLLFSAVDHGTRRVFVLDVADGSVRKLFEANAFATDFHLAPKGDSVAYIRHDERHLPEVWISDFTGEQKQLTRRNADLLEELALGALEPLAFENDGAPIQGFVLPPVGLEPGKRYPLVLNIKGGPGGMWGHRWQHEFQMLAGKGWGVAFVNYRGSTGYGDAHQKAVRLDYGGVDYRDNMKLLDTVLERYDWIDRDRLFVTGGSHGGFLTNWIITQTDRFRAAVTQRSVASWLSEAGTQQYTPRQMREEFGGSPWENFDYYWDRSPIRYADRIKTPTLILHSDEDHICPIGQAQEMFYALKAHDVETELVIFRGENHSLSRNGTPVNLVERLRRIIDWFERYL